jgi:acyl-CoA synthetase (NDP forming)
VSLVPDLAKLFWPTSVAVIGASPDTSGLRGRVLHVMLSQPFRGTIYPVTRTHGEVQGLKAYPSVAALPECPDLAILIIPAKFVPDELERCGAHGIRAAVILSSGFAEETGGAGEALQQQIRAIAKRYDLAVCGPNAEGFANTAIDLCPTFSPVIEPNVPLLPNPARVHGQVAVVAQSGGMGFAFFDRGKPKNIAFRYIVTTGNEACLEAFDYVEFMLEEGKTDAFLLLIEDIRSPKTFERVAARALVAGKPLIVNKIGQSEAGSRAAQSHTAALSGSHAVHRAMFERYGIIEGRDLDEMLDIAAGFLAFRTRLPAGRRVGICTASGGGGAWLADACAAAGLDVPELDAKSRAAIDVHLPPYGTSQNPVDGTAQAITTIGYAELARLVAASPLVDSVMAVVSTRRVHHLERERERLFSVARGTVKPILMWSYTRPSEECAALLSEAGYPLFTNMHHCARTARLLADYREARERFLAREKRSDHPAIAASDRAKARDILAAKSDVLTEWEARPLLSLYGIGAGDCGVLARSPDEAEAAAHAIGHPVALKVQSPDIPHKTDAGALALNVAGPSEARAAYDRVLAAAKQFTPAARIDGVLVQPMAAPGREMILGITRDERWGPLLMIGLGGVLAELHRDVALAPVPLTIDEARALVGRLKSARILETHRGLPDADVDALVNVMVRLSVFAVEHAEHFSEIDLNPVIVHPKGGGVSIVDALIIKVRDRIHQTAAER